MSDARTFPDHYPPCCPPEEASPASGIVYRVLKHDPPTPADFESWYEQGKLPRHPNPTVLCQIRGLSVLRVLRDAVHQRELLPHLGEQIAVGTLTPDHGLTMLTRGKQPTHTTWWCYDGIERHRGFSIVVESGEAEELTDVDDKPPAN